MASLRACVLTKHINYIGGLIDLHSTPGLHTSIIYN